MADKSPSSGSPNWIDKALREYTDNTGDVIKRISKTHLSVGDVVNALETENPGSLRALHLKRSLVGGEDGVAAETHLNIWAVHDNIVGEFNSDPVNGLSSEQVVINRNIYGRNVWRAPDRPSVLKLFVSTFISPVVLLLLVAAGVSFGFGEIAEGSVIISIVLINALLSTYMEKSAGDALEALNKLSAPQSAVIRDGVEVLLPAAALVPGDLIKLSIGSNVPVDLRLVEISDLRTNEATLTGEPEDMPKYLYPSDPASPFANNLCFASTYVVNGSGLGIAYATGETTQVGKIAAQLIDAKKSRKESRTPLQNALNRLGGIIGLMAICILVGVVIVAVVTGYRDPTHGSESRVLAVSELSLQSSFVCRSFLLLSVFPCPPFRKVYRWSLQYVCRWDVAIWSQITPM